MSEEQIVALKAKRDAAIHANDTKWQHEIEQLEQRTEEHTDLDIGSDIKIAIFTRLNEKRKKRYAKLIKELQSLGTKKKVGTGVFDEKGEEIGEWKKILTKSDETRAEDIAYEIMAFVTINPIFTVDWFKENPDKFAMEDLFNNIYLYYNLQAIRWVEQAASTKSFLAKSGGTKLR